MYKNLAACIDDLERNGHLIRIKEEVDPYLEMAAIHRRVYDAGGPAILFERVKGSRYAAVSNLFGTIERSKFIFRHTWQTTQDTVALRNNPVAALKHPLRSLRTAFAALKALPWKKANRLPAHMEEIQIADVPLIQIWPDDGGAFITLPQVYSEDPDKPGMMTANLGMYRVQLSGNDYVMNEEIGLHYQIHRGIGVHQSKANRRGEPLKVSIFVGGPPSHTLAAVMPLPEGLGEMTFAGLLGGRRVRYSYVDGYCVSHDADFVITGEIYGDETKPEGPFGDHLGYYSLTHEFPLLKVHKVYARKNAIWPFTVVGRPPQEDTSFGDLIHQLTGDAIKHEIPGVKEVHAVDAAGVHPLLFAIGSERYTPYAQTKRPAELLTLANRILGTGQLSLAKYLFITADQEGKVDSHHEAEFISYLLERIDLQRDIHLQTNTTIDTLDYTGTGLNEGSKVILAAYGEAKRTLCHTLPDGFADSSLSEYGAQFIFPGVVAVQLPPFTSYEAAEQQLAELRERLATHVAYDTCPLIVVCDDSAFTAASVANFLWVTFTRSNPSHDLYGVHETLKHKHWGCDALIIDARVKPFHAPPLVPVEEVEQRAKQICKKYGL